MPDVSITPNNRTRLLHWHSNTRLSVSFKEVWTCCNSRQDSIWREKEECKIDDIVDRSSTKVLAVVAVAVFALVANGWPRLPAYRPVEEPPPALHPTTRPFPTCFPAGLGQEHKKGLRSNIMRSCCSAPSPASCSCPPGPSCLGAGQAPAPVAGWPWPGKGCSLGTEPSTVTASEPGGGPSPVNGGAIQREPPSSTSMTPLCFLSLARVSLRLS